MVGCVKKIDVQYDSQYGVKYQLDDLSKSVVVHLDPTNNDVVSSILITSSNSSLNEDIAYSLMKNHFNYFPFDNVKETTYYISKNNDSNLYFECIEIDFYRLENMDQVKDLLQYLQLEKELEDGILYYQEELLKTDDFIFSSVLDEGIFYNNISMTQEEKYEYK